MEKILRFAWHLTSIAWLSLLAIAAGLPSNLGIALAMLPSAALVFFLLRGHLAWPLFAFAGMAALQAESALPLSVLTVCVTAAAFSLLVIASLHVFWAFGGSTGLHAAIPVGSDGRPVFQPPRWLTFLVAIGLYVFCGLLMAAWLLQAPPYWLRILLRATTLVMVLRSIGDGKQVGFTKTHRDSLFARWDDRLYTPLAVLLAFASTAALLK